MRAARHFGVHRLPDGHNLSGKLVNNRSICNLRRAQLLPDLLNHGENRLQALFQGHFNRPACLIQDQALEKFDLLCQLLILGNHLLNLADGMEDGRMIATAETPADLRKGARSHRL